MFARQFIRSPRVQGAAAVALLGTAMALGSARADSELEPCADARMLQRAVQRLNELRQHADAPCAAANTAVQALAWDTRLAGSAQQQASDLALHDRLSHVDAQQRGFGARLRQAGYAAVGAGENLAAGQTSFDDTLEAWLLSPPHCANLMRPDFRDVGLACVQRRGSQHETFWVAHLGAAVSAASRSNAFVAAR